MFWSVGGLRRKEEVVSFGVIIAASHSFTDENGMEKWDSLGKNSLCRSNNMCFDF